MERFVFVLLICLSSFWGQAQEMEIVLPYHLVGGKMIIEMEMNGQLRPFIFDTGGQTALTEELCTELNLPEFNSQKITDVNGKESVYRRVLIKELCDLNHTVSFTEVPAIVIPAPSPFICFQVDGLIGSDLLRYFVVEIDSKSKTIKLISKQILKLPSLRKMSPFTKKGFMPIISLQVGVGNEMKVLFDTGFSGFLNFKKSDFSQLQSRHAFHVLDEGYGRNSIGIGGIAKLDTMYRVLFDELTICGTKIMNVVSETANPPFTLVGVKLLDYGKVTIDYPRGRFYFDTYEDKMIKMDDVKYYKFALMVEDGDLVVSTIWSSVKEQVSIGDKVMKINGKPVGKYDFCESILNGIQELKKKKTNKLTLQTKNGERVVVYKKD